MTEQEAKARLKNIIINLLAEYIAFGIKRNNSVLSIFEQETMVAFKEEKLKADIERTHPLVNVEA